MLLPTASFPPLSDLNSQPAELCLHHSQSLSISSKMSFSLFTTIALAVLLSIATTSKARDFVVGGSTSAWSIPSPTSSTLNQWAESTRFQVGDSLVWNLEGRKDSVLQVSRGDYLSCNVSSPIAEHREEAVSVKLEQSGAYYFVSGKSEACEKGEKMAVVVMAERRRPHYEFFASWGPSTALSKAESPAGGEDGPALAPTSGGARKVAGVAVWLVVMGLAL